MDKGLLQELIAYFKQKGIIAGAGIDTFIEAYPPLKPDTAIVLFEYLGLGAVDVEAANRSVQINVRSRTDQEARAKAWELYKSLLNYSSIINNGTRYFIINVRQTPFKTGRDDRKRVIYTFNISVITQND